MVSKMHEPMTVTILTKNSAKYLVEVIRSLHEFDEVLVYDTGSCDNTLEIARSFPNVSIYEGSFKGFGLTHNNATALARNEWILSIDSDEVMTEELAQEILREKLQRGMVYSLTRKNLYRGKWIKGCGWSPDRQFRLYNRHDTAFTDAKVHEAVEVKQLKHHPFKGHIIHYSYNSVDDFLFKMHSYSSLFAEQNVGRKSASFGTALSHALFTFFKSYFLKKGFLDGKEGFEISWYNANTAFYKYLKLIEANSIKSDDVPKKKEDE